MRETKIILPKSLKIEMMKFFMNTSVLRMLTKKQ